MKYPENDLNALRPAPREPLFSERSKWWASVAINALILGSLWGLIWAGMAALGQGPGPNIYFDVGVAAALAYVTGRYAERYYTHRKPGQVTRLPLHLGYWIYGTGWCPNRVVLEHALSKLDRDA